MLRFLIRALGLIALAAAFAAAVMDGARSIANGGVSLTPIGTALAQLAPAKFEQMQAAVQKLNPKLWDPVLLDALYAPTFLVLAIVGFLLAALAAPRAERKP